MCTILKNYPNCFPKQLLRFTFPPAATHQIRVAMFLHPHQYLLLPFTPMVLIALAPQGHKQSHGKTFVLQGVSCDRLFEDEHTRCVPCLWESHVIIILKHLNRALE